MASIRQNAYPDLLPDFRNLGVIARVLLAVNAAALAGTLFAMPQLAPGLERFVQAAAFLEPLLLIELLALFALSPWLRRLPYLAGCFAVLAMVMAVAAAYHAAAHDVGFDIPPSMARTLVLSLLVAAGPLSFFFPFTQAV